MFLYNQDTQASSSPLALDAPTIASEEVNTQTVCNIKSDCGLEVHLYTRMCIHRDAESILVECGQFVNNIKKFSKKIKIKMKKAAIKLSCIHFVSFACTITIML